MVFLDILVVFINGRVVDICDVTTTRQVGRGCVLVEVLNLFQDTMIL